MKQIIIIVSLFLSQFIWAQDATTIKIEKPQILPTLKYGETFKFEDVALKFVEVLEDSRCPKNVTCVWAGEVVILVDVFKNGKKVEQKKLTLSPTSHLQDLLGNLFSSEELKIGGFNVLPYPISGSKIKRKDYYIQLDVRGN